MMTQSTSCGRLQGSKKSKGNKGSSKKTKDPEVGSFVDISRLACDIAPISQIFSGPNTQIGLGSSAVAARDRMTTSPR